MEIFKRKCLVCKTKFEVKSNFHWLCSAECARVKGNEALEKKKAQIKKTEWTKEKSELKEKLLTHSNWIQLLQTVFNTFIRMRDKELPCISCGRTNVEEFHAGHYVASTYQYHRFNENNVHKQCSYCNTHLRGNLIDYRKGLIAKIGLEEVEYLENTKRMALEITIYEIKQKIRHYKEKIKSLK